MAMIVLQEDTKGIQVSYRGEECKRCSNAGEYGSGAGQCQLCLICAQAATTYFHSFLLDISDDDSCSVI